MKPVRLIRTNSKHEDFQTLIYMLDSFLSESYEAANVFYAQFNEVGSIGQVVLAYKGQHAIGCGALKKYDHASLEIKRMFVEPSSRRMGIASMILTELEQWTHELGYDTLILETGIKQISAYHLYVKSGFERIPNYGPYSGVNGSLCFRKLLLPQRRARLNKSSL